MLPEKPPILKVGQKVKIKNLSLDEALDLDIKASKQWGTNYIGTAPAMQNWFGKEVTISGLPNYSTFEIEEDNGKWWWSRVWIDLVETETVCSIDTSLKDKNTNPSATNCASCGAKLKDPGMGPIYKHCPKCEP